MPNASASSSAVASTSRPTSKREPFFPAPFKVTEYKPRPVSPSKRQRLKEPTTDTSIDDPEAYFSARYESTMRVYSVWNSLAKRYSKKLDEDDIVDLSTGDIIKDRGVLRSAPVYDIGCFGDLDPDEEEEPVDGENVDGDEEGGDGEEDEEGGGEDDAEGEVVGGHEEEVPAEEEEEDEFESWNDNTELDYQYLNVPAVSARNQEDAEDLEAFLLAEAERRELEGDVEADLDLDLASEYVQADEDTTKPLDEQSADELDEWGDEVKEEDVGTPQPDDYPATEPEILMGEAEQEDMLSQPLLTRRRTMESQQEVRFQTPKYLRDSTPRSTNHPFQLLTPPVSTSSLYEAPIQPRLSERTRGQKRKWEEDGDADQADETKDFEERNSQPDQDSTVYDEDAFEPAEDEDEDPLAIADERVGDVEQNHWADPNDVEGADEEEEDPLALDSPEYSAVEAPYPIPYPPYPSAPTQYQQIPPAPPPELLAQVMYSLNYLAYTGFHGMQQQQQQQHPPSHPPSYLNQPHVHYPPPTWGSTPPLPSHYPPNFPPPPRHRQRHDTVTPPFTPTPNIMPSRGARKITSGSNQTTPSPSKGKAKQKVEFADQPSSSTPNTPSKLIGKLSIDSPKRNSQTPSRTFSSPLKPKTSLSSIDAKAESSRSRSQQSTPTRSPTKGRKAEVVVETPKFKK